MSTNLMFSDDLRSELYKGVKTLSDAVKVTMGPKGRNVIISQMGEVPHITKDGVTVAKNITLSDPIQRMGAELVKQVSLKTATEAGDGTTTATVLAHAIFKEGLRAVTAGADPISLKRGMDKATKLVVQNLKKNAIEVTSKEQIQQVATISANSDKEVGEIIANAMDAVGLMGVVTVENSNTMNDELEVVQGTRLMSGMLSPYFSTSKDKAETVFKNPYILFYQNHLHSLKDLVKLLGEIKDLDESILIVTCGVNVDVIETLALNKVRGALDVVAIKSPGAGGTQIDFMKDYASLTGATVVTGEVGNTLASCGINHLGKAEKVIVTDATTTIINGAGTKADIDVRISNVNEMKKTSNEFMLPILEQRLGSLSGGVAILKIGAVTETELNEKKDRVDDSLCATRAAIEEGICAGGGTALINASNVQIDSSNADELFGAKIILSAISAPLKQIVENAGYTGDVILEKVIESKLGFNAFTGEYVDLVENGIIDPVKVERVALEQACSVAGLLLTSECSINMKPD